MRSLRYFLLLSIAINFACAGVFLLGRARRASVVDGAPEARSAARSLRPPSDEGRATAGSRLATNTTPVAEKIVAALESRDAATLRDQLRAFGLPDQTVATMVRAVLWMPYYERQRSLLELKRETKPFWQGYATGLSSEERAELREMSREIRDQTRQLLGPEGYDATGTYAARYNYLPPEKAALLQSIESDYSDMRSQLNEEVRNFRVPSDATKFSYLDEARRKDIEAALSPEELVEYDMRHSNASSVVRSRLANLDITEAEFRAVYAAQKAIDDGYPIPSNRGTPAGTRTQLTPEQAEQARARRAAQEAANDQIKAILGEHRYAEYVRTADADFRNLQTAARRFNLPTTTVEEVYALREQTATASQAIGNDATLTAEQKRAALGALVDRTRQNVRTLLGDEVGNTYLNGSMRWLNDVQRGATIEFTEFGRRTQPVRGAAGPRATGQRRAAPAGGTGG